MDNKDRLKIKLSNNGDKFTKQKLYRRGNLRWTGPRFRSTIEFVDNHDGKLYITPCIK